MFTILLNILHKIINEKTQFFSKSRVEKRLYKYIVLSKIKLITKL